MAMSKLVSALHVLALITVPTASASGIIGFGISLYQDLCCQSCHDSLSKLYLNCTTFPEGMDAESASSMSMDMGMDMSMMPETSEECYASNTPWLQTMAYCIQKNCNADGYPTSKQAECFSKQALGGATEPTFQDSLPSSAPTEELAADALWLNSTSLVNGDTYYSTHGTLGEFARSEYIHTRYSLILYLIVIGFILACGLFVQTQRILPGFQKQLQTSTLWAKCQQAVFLPALFRSRRLEPLPANAGYVPGRALTISIAVYVIINIILCSVSYRSFQPNIYFLSKGFELCEYVGNRTGTISIVNMSIAILFAGRNNILMTITGWSQTTFMTLHRWTARVATLQAVVHSIVYTMAYWEQGYEGASAYAAKAAEPFYYWGIIATIAMCLILPFALLAFRIKFYETFLVIHIALVILTLAATWYHIVPHFGYVYGYQTWLYLCFAFWVFDRVARVARVGFYSHLGSSKAIVERVPGCDVMHVTVYPRTTIGFGVGQHTFLYFPYIGVGKFWESHPFSVVSWGRQRRLQPSNSSSASSSAEKRTADDEINVVGAKHGLSTHSRAITKDSSSPLLGEMDERPSISFMMRAHTGFTRTLLRDLFTSDTRPAEIAVYTEGPYGGHGATLQPLVNADTVICLVGGIGITNILGLVQEYTSGKFTGGESQSKTRGLMKKAKRLVLLWSAREMALIDFVKDRFLSFDVEVEGIECAFWCTGNSKNTEQDSDTESQKASGVKTGQSAVATRGRMMMGTELRSHLEKGQQTTIVVCGPSQMTDEATREVVGCIKEGYRVDLVEEAFSW
ncbi:hypothetical protein EJ05DRAFT_498945 [Pseudovirgaria hyperparasitica]|uniref:FAD-binding FR-type domain-containing protein n=1 Tax=Pseudovirgaria hyperparasitica TaxID=470096 RepID=A0A6A6WA59_9PEZI|nr:uncharacterized protein EJ05DRAFT_498945 [Pseudovirgaria hyperparasitica]KAF2759742.1 hypothetical protein EJ05DRAFT_498945 [Pseudovirgaria hyperparasitica]